MRQAGRILPQYRALRGKLSGFIELVTTPSLAAEVTIQPVDELGVDAAIIFSDILVIPEVMGLPYVMKEGVGPRFPETIQSEADIERLISGKRAAESLTYVYDALNLTKKALNNKIPLIGFAGAPWTLFAYMVEGKGSKTFARAKKMLYQEPKMAHQLLEKITETIIEYLKLKIAAGADLVQVFDSWAGLLGPELYRSFALPYLKTICEAVSEAPITVFAKGAWYIIEDLMELNCQVIGLDWTIAPDQLRSQIGYQVPLQGNLDPCQLYAPATAIETATLQMIKAFGSNHIVNLGHGVYPDTPLEGVKCFVETVKSYRY